MNYRFGNNDFLNLFFYFYLSHSILGLIAMSDRKSRFNLFGFNKRKNNLNWSDDSKNASFSDDGGNDLGFPSFDSIIPESSPLKKNSD